MKGSYLILGVALFLIIAGITAILLAWPVISYLASESFG
jgi:hypothetical protein